MATRAAFLSVLLLIATWLAGCQLVLGDFEVEDAPGGRTAQCTEKFRCNGPWLFCETKSGGDYRLVDTCASEVQCDSMAGRCTVCMPGEFRCAGARLETCNVDGTKWELVVECPTADQCNLNSRSCRACTPGEMPQCGGLDQLELSECGPDSQWVPLGVCATPLLCQRSAEAIAADPMAPRQCVEPACEAGAFRCEPDGVSLSRCAPDLTAWVPVDTCQSVELCAATVADPIGADARGGKCLLPGCFPAGAVQCVEERLERCPESLVSWTEVITCAPPYQCNTNAEACTGMCTPGDQQCSGNILQRCNDAQLWEDEATCVNASLCQVMLDPVTQLFAGGCVEPRCEPPGEVRCVGTALERCNTEQTQWDPEATCLSDALCNVTDETCDPPTCEPAGTLRCNPTNPSELQRCSDDLTAWVTETVCAQTEACNTDPIGPPCINQCPDPPERCSAVAYETCSGVTGVPLWTGRATCATADLCNCGLAGTCAGGTAPDGFCHLPVCGANLGSTRCNGSRVETCQPGRNGWNTTAECGTAAMCIPGTPAQTYFDGSYCAVCSVASERQCNGASVRTCSADRRSWIATEQCAPLTCINSGTNDYCAVCTPGNERCSNGDVQACGADSRWSGAVTDCGAFACVANGNSADCGVCQPGQTRCVSGSLQTCGSNSNWGAGTACGTFGCIDNGTADYCGECAPGQTACHPNGIRTCGDNSRWGMPTACSSLGCIDSGTADYCAVCTPGHRQCASGSLETCGANSLWGAGTPCGSFGCVNSGTADYCAECMPGQRRCVGASLETCGTDSRWGAGTACGTFGCIDDGTADYCGECAPGSSECQTSNVRTCGADSLWDAAVACGSLGCVNSGTSDYCAECTPGHAQCTMMNEALETCGSNSRWGAPAACSLGCINSGTDDYCAECTPGHIRCSGGDTQTCGTNSRWGAVVDCGTFECVNSGNMDYCGECTAGDSRCTAGDTEVCPMATLLWTAGADCAPYACYDPAPAAAYCGECTPGETLCSSDLTSLRTCGTDGRWDAGMACPTACVVGPPDACM